MSDARSGACLRCGILWTFAEWHITRYGAADEFQRVTGYGWTHGLFPLCEPCWAALSPPGRLPFYRQLVFDIWQDPGEWPAVEAAVLAEGQA